MGACFNSVTCDGKLSKDQVHEKYKSMISDLLHEYGADAYNGTFTTCSGLSITSNVFDSEDEFMSNAQLLGVDTPNCDSVDEVKTGIEEAVKERRLVTAGVSTNKKGYRNVYLRGVYDGDAPEAAEEAPAATAKPKAAAKKSPPPAKDEWEEETAVEAPAEEVEAAEEEEAAEDDGSYLPSECVGYECVYDDAVYIITAGDDEAMTVDFKDEEGNEYGPVSYDEISFPEE